MRTLILSPSFPPTATPEADYAFALCRGLRDRGFGVDVVTTARSGLGEMEGVRLHPLMSRWSWREMPKLARAMHELSPDAILLHYCSWLFNHHPMANYLPTLAKRIVPDATFTTLFLSTGGAKEQHASLLSLALHHGFEWATGKRGAGFPFGNLFADSDQVVLRCSQDREPLKPHLGDSQAKLEVIPSFPLMRQCTGERRALRAEGRKRLGVTANDFVFVYLGHLFPGKGIDTLLSAFARVLKEQPTAKLVILGNKIDPRVTTWSTYTDCLSHLSWALGTEASVLWRETHPWPSDTSSLHLYAADACVLPFDQGLRLSSTALAAASAHGLPLIATRGGTLEPPLANDQNIMTCPPRDPYGLSRTMAQVLADPHLAARLAAGATRLAEDFLSREKALDRWQLLLESPKQRGVPVFADEPAMGHS